MISRPSPTSLKQVIPTLLLTAAQSAPSKSNLQQYSILIMQDKIVSLKGLCCNEIDYFDFKNKKNLRLNKLFKKNSERVKTGYGNSHNKVFQEIIDEKLKKGNYKKNLPLKAIDTLDSLKLLNMLYMSYEKNKWIYYGQDNIQSRLGN